MGQKGGGRKIGTLTAFDSSFEGFTWAVAFVAFASGAAGAAEADAGAVLGARALAGGVKGRGARGAQAVM